MIRKALIIGGYDTKNVGVDADLKHYSSFLHSCYGGGWYESEVKILNSPSKFILNVAIAEVKQADFSFVVFTGHGGFNTKTQKLELDAGEDYFINYDKLCGLTTRQILITDCCRDHYQPKAKVCNESFQLNAFDSSAPNFNICRKKYTEAVLNGPRSQTSLYSCSDDEFSNGGPKKGGSYSFHLLNNATKWATHTSQQTLDVTEAHALAERSVTADPKNKAQNPDIHTPRTWNQFPFAVTYSY